MNDQRSGCKIYIENCDFTATKLLKQCFLQCQQHSKLPHATSEKKQAASNFIDQSVQDFSDFDKESKDPNPESVFKPRVAKANHKLFSNLGDTRPWHYMC